MKQRAVVALAFACALPTACKKNEATPYKPPFEAFKPGEWKTPKGVVLKVPAIGNHDWRVLAFQERPRQKKNPHWKPIAVGESGLLEMPEGSHFRCLYEPVAFRPWPNEHLGIDQWEVMRAVRCSNDGWATYSQAVHVVSVNGDGSKVVPSIAQTELTLVETIDGKVVQEALVLRAD
ncbi:MAG TPA: hypothetical protein VH062_27100 [Polyangiaceae bacterium]|nr:hypothetical protein [Polyangiaceae bacterium]